MIYATDQTSILRVRILRWATPLGLLLTSAVLILHQTTIWTLAEHIQDKTDSVALQLLEERIIDLEQLKPALKLAPSTVTQGEFQKTRDDLNQRLTDLYAALIGTALNADLLALKQQLQQFESSHQQATPPPLPKISKLKINKAKQLAEPAFQIIGRESRGGQRFLSIHPVGSRILDQSRLMQIDEIFSGWQLKEFDEHTAVFFVDGQTRRLNIR